MKHIKRFSFIVAALFLATLTTQGCKKEHDKTTICDQIEGAWKESFSPHSRFYFDAGFCTQVAPLSNGETLTIEYSYTCQSDTLTLVNLQSGSAHKWHFSFQNDSTALIIKTNTRSILTRIP